jgi:outer membrane protein, heavy metal efflux system
MSAFDRAARAPLPAHSTARLPLALALLLAACASSSRHSTPEEPATSADDSPRITAPSAPTPADAPTLPPDATLAEYLAFAAAHHPALGAAHQRWRAGRERIAQADSLPDPTFTYRYYIEEVQTRVGPQRHAFGLRQMFPWFGETGLRGEVAASDAEVAGARFEALRLRVLEEVQVAYAEHYYLARGTEVLRGNVELFRYIEGVLRERYGVGAARHQDVIRAQLELGKLADRLRRLEDLRGASAARLAAAVGLDPGTPIEMPESLEQRPLEIEDATLLARLAERSPELAALDAEIERGRSAIELAEKQFYPDFGLGVETIDTGEALNPSTPGSGQDAWMVSLSIDLPVRRARLHAGVREARARHMAAQAARADLEIQLEAHARMALFELRDAARRIELYRTALIPKARESLRATESALGLGTGTFLDLVDAQRALLEFELGHERALTDHVLRRAELERLAGGDLETFATDAAEDGGTR